MPSPNPIFPLRLTPEGRAQLDALAVALTAERGAVVTPTEAARLALDEAAARRGIAAAPPPPRGGRKKSSAKS